jgi:capsular polysaccharide biosynthesis protein
VSSSTPPSRGFDPEAEQEVDFAKYVRLLAFRWWLLAAGLVIGAVIGYAVSLGGTQVYSATATIYLGQPLTPGGNGSVQTLATNPSAVGQIIHSLLVDNLVARKCKAKASLFRKGISSSAVSGSGNSKTNTNPLVTISVQTKKKKLAACAATGLANQAVSRLGPYPKAKIANLDAEIAADRKAIAAIQQATSDPSVSSTDKLVVGLTLRNYQVDENTALQLLTTAKNVESPSLVTGAAAQKVTARSRRNTVLIAALIGLVLGAVVALLWDRVAARLPAGSA